MASSSTTTVANVSHRLTTFHPFPRLPKELRLMIWELLLPGPRIVDLNILKREVRMGDWLRDWDEMIGGPRPGNIKYRPEDFEFRNFPLPFNQYGMPIEKSHETWTVRAEKGPVVLYVNQESQAVGKKVYDKTFRCVGMKAVTWFSYKQDTLYLSSETVNRVLRQNDLGSDILGVDFSKVQKLLLGSCACECPHGFTQYNRLCRVISWFGKLKHLTLVSETEGPAVRDTLIDIPSIYNLEIIASHYRDGYATNRDLELNKYLAKSSNHAQGLLTRNQLGITVQREFWENNQKSPKNLWDWEPPIIDRKSIISTELNTAFDNAVEKYNRQRALYSISVNLTVWGGEVFRFTAGQSSTVGDMIEAFRKARRYSVKRVINIEHEGKTLDSETRVLTLENVDSLLFLNVVIERK